MSWAGRQRNMIDFTLSSLWRRKGKNAALGFVYTAVVTLLASTLFFAHALKREARLLLAGSPEVVVQRILAGRHDLVPQAYAERLAGLRGVSAVSGRLWGYYYDPVTRANFTLLVPDAGEPPAGALFLGRGAARLRGVGKGAEVALRGADGAHRRFRVEGVFAAESELVTTDLVLVSARDFRDFFGVPEGYFTDLTLRVRNPAEVATVAAKVQRELPDTRQVLRSEILRTYDAVFDWRGGLVLMILASSVLAFVVLAWDKASGLSAEEKREIGILKAVGWETSDVILLKFWEGCVVSVTSFLSGLLLAYAHVFLLGAPLFAAVLKGWSRLYPAFRLVPFVDPYLVGVLFVLAVVPYTAATVVPSWRAATTDPAAAMRG